MFERHRIGMVSILISTLSAKLYVLILFKCLFNYPHRRYNGLRARPEYGRSWVRIPIGSKPKTTKLVFVTSPLSTQNHEVRAKTGCLGIMKMCRSRATCLPADSCLSEKTLLNPTQRDGLLQSGYHHHYLIKM
jgi:hypothetical protein